MKTESSWLAVAFAIFAGSIIGSLVAIRAEPSLLWLAIGIVSGGLAGYVLVAPLQFLSGVRHGFAHAISETLPNLTAQQLKVNEGFGRIVRNIFVFTSVSIAWLMCWFAMIYLCNICLLSSTGRYFDIYLCLILVVALGSGGAISALCLDWGISILSGHEESALVELFDRIRYRKSLEAGNDTRSLVTFVMILTGLSPIGLAVACVSIVVRLSIILTVLTAKGIVKSFIFLHSEARVQTAAYAVLGTTAMWYIHASVSVIIAGAAVGAALGAVGYRFVSSRFISSVQAAT